MGKLHEVLAVEPSLKGAVDKLIGDTEKTFDSRNAAYSGFSKVFTKKTEEDQDQVPESKVVGYTVKKKLDFLSDHYAKFIDAVFQKELGNQVAKADIKIVTESGGKETEVILAEGVPATMLLSLEHRLEELRKRILDNAPTLDPNFAWKWSENEGCWVTPAIQTISTKKKPVVITKSPATDKFPAQTEILQDDVQVGTWSIVHKSGALAVTEKADMITRLDILLRAVKTARMRANDIEIKSVKMGKRLFDFITGKAV
jgi:hypothetical protein